MLNQLLNIKVQFKTRPLNSISKGKYALTPTEPFQKDFLNKIKIYHSIQVDFTVTYISNRNCIYSKRIQLKPEKNRKKSQANRKRDAFIHADVCVCEWVWVTFCRRRRSISLPIATKWNYFSWNVNSKLYSQYVDFITK